MTRADEMRANALHEVGEDYVWGAEGTGGIEGPDDYDCSGFVWAMFRDVGVRFTRTTAEGLRRKAARLSHPFRVGHLGFLLNSNGSAHHVVLYIGRDTCVEAKGKAYGVVKTSVDALESRGVVWGSLGIDLGELTTEAKPKPRRYPGHIVGPWHKHGDEVRWVQKRVGAHADGVFGPKTADAVKRFKRSHGMLSSARVGRKTWVKLGGRP